MKKSKIKAATNENLILYLAIAMSNSRVYKGTIKSAKWICEELANRKVVDDPVSFFNQWSKAYEF